MSFKGESDQKRRPRVGATRTLQPWFLGGTPAKNGVPELAPLDCATMFLVGSAIKKGVPGLAPLGSTTMIFLANAIKNWVEK